MKILLVIVLLAFSAQLYFAQAAESDDYILELVHVLFRHGDRVTEKHEVYKDDPYEEVFKRHGYGQMTNSGKQRMYNLGKVLRERYSSFLGTDYQPTDVHARSTDTDRTKMSLLLVLAGLYPPSNKTSWSDTLDWIPIPIHYEPKERDFLYSFQKCKSYNELFQQQLDAIPEKILDRAFVERMYNRTGWQPASMTLLYFNLRAVQSLNLPLPDWCSSADHEQILRFAEEAYAGVAGNELMGKMTTGPFIEKLYQNLEDHDRNVGAKKIYLYSAHDYNIASFTKVHNFTEAPKLPDFGSTVVLEKLRGADQRVYLRMQFWSSVSERWIPLKLSGCANECPLDGYKKIVENILPNEQSRICLPVDKSCSMCG